MLNDCTINHILPKKKLETIVFTAEPLEKSIHNCAVVSLVLPSPPVRAASAGNRVRPSNITWRKITSFSNLSVDCPNVVLQIALSSLDFKFFFSGDTGNDQIYPFRVNNMVTLQALMLQFGRFGYPCFVPVFTIFLGVERCVAHVRGNSNYVHITAVGLRVSKTQGHQHFPVGFRLRGLHDRSFLVHSYHCCCVLFHVAVCSHQLFWHVNG